MFSALVFWVGVRIMRPAETKVMVSPLILCVQYVKLSGVSLGTRPRESLVAVEDVKKPNK